jgi:hypothetical protein
MAAYLIQAFSPKRANSGVPYGGRYFAAHRDTRRLDSSASEWAVRKHVDLDSFWPRTKLPEGFKTSYQRIAEHGYPDFASLFNALQLLVHDLAAAHQLGAVAPANYG